MKVEDMLKESHENMVEGISALLVKMAVDNGLVHKDNESYVDIMRSTVEVWLNTDIEIK